MTAYSKIAINYGISDNIESVEEKGNGYYVIANDCNYYIPKNCSNSTNGIIFYHGAGGWKADTDRMVDHIEGNIDSIIVFPKANYSFGSTTIDQTNIELNSRLEKIMNNVGANVGNVSTVTFSAGDVGGIQGLAYNIDQHPEIKGQVCVLVDPKADETGYGGERLMYNDNSDMMYSQSDTIRLLSENKATLIVYEQESSLNDLHTLANYERFAKSGVNVIMIGGPSDHVSEFQNALDKNMLAYMSGDYTKLDSLNQSRMIKFNHSTGTWVEASTSDIVTAYNSNGIGLSKNNNLLNLFNISEYDYLKNLQLYDSASLSASLGYSDASVTSEIKSVIEGMNFIRKNVSDTKFLGSLGNKLSNFSASNRVLEYESNLIASYFNITGNLLNKVSFLTDAIVNVAFIIDEIDANLTKSADQLLNSGLAAQNLSASSPLSNQYNLSLALMRNLSHGYNLNLTKYSENRAAGFELRLSNRIYSLNDFNSTYARERWGYDEKLAREAFIGVCIAECDKTPDGMLGVVSVALNRCESGNWSNYYTKSDSSGTTDGKNPFDQMFVNNGGQYSVITNGNYKNYMPSLVGRDKVNDYLRHYYNISYEELEQVANDALQGGVRNNFYTGFRANNGQYSGIKLDPTRAFCNLFRYENANVDSIEAQNARDKLISVSLNGTSYSGRDSIMVSANSPSFNNASVSPSLKPIISFERMPSLGGLTHSLDSHTSPSSSDFSGEASILAATHPISTSGPVYSTQVPSTEMSQPIISVESGPTVESPVTSISDLAPPQGYSSSGTQIPSSVGSVVSGGSQSSMNFPSSSTSQSVEPQPSSDIPVSDTYEPTFSIDDSSLNINESTTLTGSNQSVDSITPNSSVHRNSQIKNIGLATAGAAALGGLAYAGTQTIKKIKENQSIDEDDETEDRKDGDDK